MLALTRSEKGKHLTLIWEKGRFSIVMRFKGQGRGWVRHWTSLCSAWSFGQGKDWPAQEPPAPYVALELLKTGPAWSLFGPLLSLTK